ncbi:electron transport complex subunit D [Anaerocolumna cellulosilytica]|uniref:Electron transport complex subunit D n=1 Tax=Anaerocolumna cellulosilytica TaxID=433286 RepID=A0A6S6R3M0_9FIRM|nr:RnfABCDGE type electron transport complex subunit D [Anaerocolumna cellulosilytica]MBB5195223.1 electron transport complex protein RnfD [Anaerocolumna cellulosilytica]BCJ96696.1 electron transport complex subunit D [Anaerocolumna cellulosilytica]
MQSKKEYLLSKKMPHIRSVITTRQIMVDVAIALLPALIGAVYFFGYRSLLLVLVSVITCVFFEFLWQKLRHEPVLIGDFSAVVTGILLSFNVPVTTPYWVVIAAGFFSIVIAKQFFGGIGSNFANPALMGRLFIMTFYPGSIASYVTTYHNGADAISSATVLSAAKSGHPLTDVSYLDMFLGNIPGSLGETSKSLLLAGFLYLCYRKVVNVQIAITYIITVIAITFTFGGDALFTGDIFTNLLGGSLILGAFYMLTDYSFASAAGKIFMGVIAGVVTAGIRIWGIYPEGVCYGILAANCLLAFIERLKPPCVYGMKAKPRKKLHI